MENFPRPIIGVFLVLFFHITYQATLNGEGSDEVVKRVIGGEIANANTWKWQAHIRRKDGNGDWHHQCGGALIKRQWVLTAAHCVFDQPDVTIYDIILGDYDRAENEASEQKFDVEYIYPHLQFFTNESYSHDIALMKLSREADLTESVSTVDLPEQGERVAKDTDCTITGWGKTGEGEKSLKLKQAVMPVVSQLTCAEGNKNLTFAQVYEDAMLCAGVSGPGTIISGCNGDSGGPFVCESSGANPRWILQGVVSWGDPHCGGATYSVFVRVSSYVDWIDKTIETLPATTGEKCKDFHYFCKEWKKMSWCSMSWYEKRMRQYCFETCEYESDECPKSAEVSV